MPGRIVYLDNQSTTPCDPRVLAAMRPLLGNIWPGSNEDEMTATARTAVAQLIGGAPEGMVFTSGATEANNLAIKGVARHALLRGERRRRIVTCTTEHKCVLESVLSLRREGFDPVILPVAPDGSLDPACLKDALSVPTLLVSVMAANNETGFVQNIAALTALAHEAGALFHTDAAQAAGKLPIHADQTSIDLLSVSGHKLYGPKGIGALWVRPGVMLASLFSGVAAPALPLIVGLGEACRIAMQEMSAEAERLTGLRDRLLAGLQASIPGLRVNGPMRGRLPGNLNIQLPANAADVLAACPDLCVSAGSACASAGLAPSYVLRAIGLSDETAQRSLRLGLGRFTSPADVDHAIQSLAGACKADLAA